MEKNCFLAPSCARKLLYIHKLFVSVCGELGKAFVILVLIICEHEFEFPLPWIQSSYNDSLNIKYAFLKVEA